jgi:hypothetical protein
MVKRAIIVKKSKLIKLLSKLDGDPDVLLWNGYVGDYQNISLDIVEQQLVRMTFDAYVKTIECEERVKRKDLSYIITESELPELRKSYTKHVDWEMNQFALQDTLNKNYKSKTVYIMQPNSRGKREWGRCESLEY